MKKEKTFKNMRLIPEGLKELDQLVTRMGGVVEVPHPNNLELFFADASLWEFEELKDFLEGYPESLAALYRRCCEGVTVKMLNFFEDGDAYARFVVEAAERKTIQTIFELIEKYVTPYAVDEAISRSCRRPARRAVVN